MVGQSVSLGVGIEQFSFKREHFTIFDMAKLNILGTSVFVHSTSKNMEKNQNFYDFNYIRKR